jgi:hypothetical protein
MTISLATAGDTHPLAPNDTPQGRVEPAHWIVLKGRAAPDSDCSITLKRCNAMTHKSIHQLLRGAAVGALLTVAAPQVEPAQAQEKRPNVVMLMSDDTGWADLGCYLGGAALGHPTPNLDRIAKEGALFTNWYGQASCTAGRASFITGRIPIRSALSVVVVPGDPNGLRKETPTIAEFYQKNGYSTYFW